MIDNKNKKWSFYRVLALSLIINVLIGANSFSDLKYTGDAAGPILKLFKQIEILAYSFVISIIHVIILSQFKKFRSNYVALIISFILAGCITFIVSDKEANPRKPTKEEILEKRVRKNQKRAKKVNRLKNGIQFFLPEDSIVQRDTTNLIREIKAILSFRDSIDIKNQEEAIQLELVNHVFSKNFAPKHVHNISQYRNSLQIEFVTYSKDLRQFLTLLTYKSRSKDHRNWYNGIVMTCEKQDQKTLCFTTYRDYEDKYSREEYMNYKLVHLFGYTIKEEVNELWQTSYLSKFIPENVEEHKKHRAVKYYSKGKDVNTEIGRTYRHLINY